MPRTAPALTIAALGLAAALTLVGCAAASDTGAAVGGNDDDSSACVADAETAVAAASAEQDLLAPTAPLDLAALEGEDIWYITLLTNQYTTDLYTGFEAAAHAAGMNPVFFDGQSNINRVVQGIEQAIAQDADGIVMVAIDPTSVTAALAQTEAAGIPVLNFMTDDVTGPVHEGTFGNLTADMIEDGQNQAWWALADSGCSADIVLMESSVLKNFSAVVDGAESVIAENCADCGVIRLDIDLANVATDVPAQVQSALQRQPDTGYILSAWDSAVPFIAPVVATTGSDVRIGGHDGIDASLEMIRDGNGQDMTMAMTPTGHQGWLAVDEVARAMLGIEVIEYVIPTRLVDSTNVGDGSVDALWPAYTDYEQAFVDAWQGE
ncbi:substrate-binding domain-containing protein [Microbacterium sp. 18062]|uniref:substrate-binding domain-containing protein n=1 Tax=Microbacterium sp. 18062 TaxID=2681410 RepID=UPI00135C5542|nr:substrate-binding domain-containing protein [Microbacterium sp. 18062]